MLMCGKFKTVRKGIAMKREIIFAAILVIAFTQFSYATDLNAPGQKKITVKSEIQRGRESVGDIRSYLYDMDMIRYLEDLERPIQKNIFNNTDSPGFQLGAYFNTWMLLAIDLEVMQGKISERDYELALTSARRFFKKYRQVQKELKIDDRTLIVDVLDMKYTATQKTINEWESNRGPSMKKDLKRIDSKIEHDGKTSSQLYRMEGFRGIKWGQNLSSINGLKYQPDLPGLDKSVKYYTRDGDVNDFEGISLDKIIYGFKNGRLLNISLFIKGKRNWDALKGKVFNSYGEGPKVPNPENREWYYWETPKIGVTLIYISEKEFGTLTYTSKEIL
jgi:hypothetical protein